MMTVQNQEEEAQGHRYETADKDKDVGDQSPVALSPRRDFYDSMLTEAINDLTPEMLKKLGIYVIYGTMMKISILHIATLWKKHRGNMFEVVENLEKVIKDIVEDVHQGLLVKITPDAFICFFPDKPKNHSILRSLSTACTLNMHMLSNPMRLENDD